LGALRKCSAPILSPLSIYTITKVGKDLRLPR
jgi:hypothetical protein